MVIPDQEIEIATVVEDTWDTAAFFTKLGIPVSQDRQTPLTRTYVCDRIAFESIRSRNGRRHS
ncbi:MAG: hypothetical protein K6U03_10090, partial [Firmicutes bacterium]|nr:hypothetical protein [Bacillota bacterium]